MNPKTNERVKCISCRYAKEDKKASDRNWKATIPVGLFRPIMCV